MNRLLHFFWFNYHKRYGDAGVYEQSNVEIQKWAEKCLEHRFAVHSTSCETQGRVTISERDILLGHLTWDPYSGTPGETGRSQRNWMRDNKLNPDDPCHPNCFVLTPWVPQFPQEWTEKMPWLESQLEQSRLIFAICGPIWLERTLALDDQSIQSRVKSKLVRLNMCVNYDALDIRKKQFNPPGRRKLVHVSNLGSYKGFDLLLDSTEGVAIPSIGSKALSLLKPGLADIDMFGKSYRINNLGTILNTDDEQIRNIVTEHDFYIHTSSMDAQATTTLEFCARGLVPIVTPESGFASADAVYLTQSAAKNKDIIRRALEMPDDELKYRSERIKNQIRQEHSWDGFFATIADKIEAICGN